MGGHNSTIGNECYQSENSLRDKLITHTNIFMVIDTLIIAVIYQALGAHEELANIYLITTLILLFLCTSFVLFSLYMPYSKKLDFCIMRDAEEKVAALLDVIYVWSIIVLFGQKLTYLMNPIIDFLPISYTVTSLVISLLVKKFLTIYHNIYEKSEELRIKECLKECGRRHTHFILSFITIMAFVYILYLGPTIRFIDLWFSLMVTIIIRFYTILS